jgi:7-keto-8-aminopelargonate synthetase-like enzyme
VHVVATVAADGDIGTAHLRRLLETINKRARAPPARLYLDTTHAVVHDNGILLECVDDSLLFGALFLLGAHGAYCAGSRDACTHQRLAVAGFCFSAALPAYEAAAAAAALDELNG